MRRDDLVDRVHPDPARHEEHEHRDGERGQRLRFTVTVGVIRVGRFRGDPKARPHQQRRQSIEQGFRAVGDQRVSVAENPTREFHRRQLNVQVNAVQDGP